MTVENGGQPVDGNEQKFKVNGDGSGSATAAAAYRRVTMRRVAALMWRVIAFPSGCSGCSGWLCWLHVWRMRRLLTTDNIPVGGCHHSLPQCQALYFLYFAD